MAFGRLRNLVTWLVVLSAASTMLTGCSTTAKDNAAFCAAWFWACAVAVVDPPRPHRPDKNCTHQPDTPPLPEPVKANSLALLDIDALRWLVRGPADGTDSPSGGDGEGNYDVFSIGEALTLTRLEFLELKAPQPDKKQYVQGSYSVLSQGANPPYLRASIRPAGSPGCEYYERFLKGREHDARNILKGQCVALEPVDAPVSRYAFTVANTMPRDFRQLRQIVDISTGKVYAEYLRNYGNGDNCPRKEVRQQFVHLIQPE
jgi:hypothetical protein